MYNGEMEKSVQTEFECQNEAARNELHVNLIPNVEKKKKTVFNLPKYDLSTSLSSSMKSSQIPTSIRSENCQN